MLLRPWWKESFRKIRSFKTESFQNYKLLGLAGQPGIQCKIAKCKSTFKVATPAFFFKPLVKKWRQRWEIYWTNQKFAAFDCNNLAISGALLFPTHPNHRPGCLRSVTNFSVKKVFSRHLAIISEPTPLGAIGVRHISFVIEGMTWFVVPRQVFETIKKLLTELITDISNNTFFPNMLLL